MAWVEETGAIPQDQLGYEVQEETTDGKLTALIYKPVYTSPTDEKTTTGSEVRVTDSTQLSKFQTAQKEDADTAYDVVKPTFSMEGTWYRATSGNRPAIQQEATKIEKYQQQMMQNCSKYKGAQYSACVKMVQARVGQMAQKIPGFAEGGYVETKGYAEGGEVMSVPEEQMQAMMAMEQMPMPEEPMMEQEATSVDGDMVERIASVLSQEEMQVLNEALDMHPELVGILDKAMEAVSTTGEFTDEGPVNGPGTETSDSIPARLSDGEFVFTAKAVKQIGVDKLRKMMAKAEDDYDTAMYKQEGNQTEAMGNEEGYFLGGLLDQTRKQWGNLESATAEYQQPMERTVPTNVDGMGRTLPEGNTGIMGRRTVDLAAQQRDQMGKQQMNTNTQSTAPAAAATPSLMGTANIGVEEQRTMDQQQLQQNAQEEDQQSLIG
jgi:hypothetical protein